MKMLFGAYVYYIWLKRTKRLHGASPFSADEIIQTILNDVKGRIFGTPRLKKLYANADSWR